MDGMAKCVCVRWMERVGFQNQVNLHRPCIQCISWKINNILNVVKKWWKNIGSNFSLLKHLTNLDVFNRWKECKGWADLNLRQHMKILYWITKGYFRQQPWQYLTFCQPQTRESNMSNDLWSHKTCLQGQHSKYTEDHTSMMLRKGCVASWEGVDHNSTWLAGRYCRHYCQKVASQKKGVEKGSRMLAVIPFSFIAPFIALESFFMHHVSVQ